jgi:aspartate-semialdehyde dehydrogenase
MLSNKSSFRVGIIGATGAVGLELISCLHARKFPVTSLHLYASARSSGTAMTTPYGEIVVEMFSSEEARKNDFVFLAVSGDFALEHAPRISEGPDGAIVIDNSSAFRYMPEIPLVVSSI